MTTAGVSIRLAPAGRSNTRRFGPRPIDLDILFYDELQMDTPRLTIPHPRIAERRFVLQPLADIPVCEGLRGIVEISRHDGRPFTILNCLPKFKALSGSDFVGRFQFTDHGTRAFLSFFPTNARNRIQHRKVLIIQKD